MAIAAKCRKCGREENLAEPFIDGACADCLRKASGVALEKPSQPPVAVVRPQPSPPVQSTVVPEYLARKPPGTPPAVAASDYRQVTAVLTLLWNCLTYLIGILLIWLG